MVTDRPRLIGIDFDNTIAQYGTLMHRIALKRGWIGAAAAKSKRAIRDELRRRPDGEITWRRLQALVYGPLMREAVPSEGFEAFLELCVRHDVPVRIVSHKTEFATFDETRTNLRDAALDWLRTRRLVGHAGAALPEHSVFFESTRLAKIERLRWLGCTHFIDDLEETFAEPTFPSGVIRMLYAPDWSRPVPASVIVMRSWAEVGGSLFPRS